MANETDTKRLLEQRNALRKPAFVVKESHFKAGVKPNWRRPRGKHSPVRQCHKGRIKMPHPGYGAPKAAYGLTRTGRVPKQVMNLADLENIDKERDAVIIASSVGLRKRIALLSVCKEKGLTLEGALDLKAEMSKCDRQFADSKKITTARRKEKQSKVKTAVADKKKGKDTKDSSSKSTTKEDTGKKAEENVAKQSKAASEKKSDSK